MGAIIFDDTITEGSTIDLSAHTPSPTGTSWTALSVNGSNIDVIGGAGYATEINNSSGNRYQTNDLARTEYDVIGVVSTTVNPGGAFLGVGVGGRQPGTNASGGYEFVYDWAVSGGAFTLGSDTSVEAWPAVDTFYTMRLEIRATVASGYFEGVLKVDSTDNPFPTTGKNASICLFNFTSPTYSQAFKVNTFQVEAPPETDTAGFFPRRPPGRRAPNSAFARRRFVQGEVASVVDATASPEAIAATTAIDAATASAGSTVEPVTIITAVTIDAATAAGGAGTSPAEITATTTMDAATLSAGSSVSPTEIVTTAIFDAVTASGSGSAEATPTEIVAVAAFDAVTATAGSSTAPATIITAVTLDAAAISAGSATSPASIIATAALDAATLSAGSTATVSEIVVVAGFDAVAATGGGNATATPTSIVAVVTIDAATAAGGAGTSPAEIVATTGFDTATVSSSASTSPATLQVVAVLDAVFATAVYFAPGSIVVIVRTDNRTVVIPADDRSLTIRAEARTVEVNPNA